MYTNFLNWSFILDKIMLIFSFLNVQPNMNISARMKICLEVIGEFCIFANKPDLLYEKKFCLITGGMRVCGLWRDHAYEWQFVGASVES